MDTFLTLPRPLKYTPHSRQLLLGYITDLLCRQDPVCGCLYEIIQLRYPGRRGTTVVDLRAHLTGSERNIPISPV